MEATAILRVVDGGTIVQYVAASITLLYMVDRSSLPKLVAKRYVLLFSAIFIIYLFLPAFCGYLANVSSSPRKVVRYRRKLRKIKLWTKADYSAAFFVLATGLFFIIGILIKAGVNFSTKKTFLILAIDCLAAIIFLYHYWGGTKFFIKYKEIIKFLIAPIAIGVATLSKIYSDAGISELSGLAPQDLPSAQLFLTLILTPVIWLVLSSLALGYSSLLLMPILMLKGLIEDYFKSKNKSKSTLIGYKNPIMNDILALVAVFIAAMLLLTIMQKVVSKKFYEPRLRQAIEFSSFHLPATYCGLPENAKVSVARVSNDTAAIAIADAEFGYKFLMINCKQKLEAEGEINKIIKKL